MASTATTLPLRTKLLYGLGSMSDGAQLQLMGGVLLLYYNQILGMPAAWVSLALGAAVVVDAFWDPFLGHVSDKIRSRLGRRHGLMYFAAIPSAVTFAALWIPPAGLGQAQLFAWLLGFVVAFRFLHSCFMVPSGALTPELAPDYHERTVLIGYRWLLGATGGAITALLAYGVFLRKTPDYPLGQLNPAGYPPMALTIAVLIAVTIIISTMGTHGRIPTLHRPPGTTTGLIQSLREVTATLNNRNFLVTLIAGALGATSTALYQGLAIYFSTFLFELAASDLVFLVLTVVIAAPAAFVIAPAASRRWGKKHACMGLFFASLLFTHLPIVFKLVGLFPANGSAALLPTLIFAGSFSAVLSMSGFILSTSMIADIVEESQVRTGRRSEGLLFSADQLLNKIVSGMATVLPGLLLALVGFPQGARPDTLDPEIMRRLAWIYVLICASLSFVSIWTWRFFRIDQAAHENNLATIEDAIGMAALAPSEATLATVGLAPSGAPPGPAPRTAGPSGQN